MSLFSDIADKILSPKGEAQLPPVKDAVEQTPDETKLVEYIKNKIDLVRTTNSRVALENVYLTNIAYTLGYNGIMFDSQYKQFRNVDPKRRLTRNQFKINKILPTVQNRLARLTQSPPKYDVRPNSNSTEDKDSARLSLDILNNKLDELHFTEVRQELLLNAMEGGVAYLQVLWDDMAGQPMIDPETQEMTGYEGDVRIDILNCLEVFVDPLAKKLDEAQWIIKAKVRKLDYFKDHYPDRGAAVKEEDSWLLSAIYDMKINSLTSVGIIGSQTHDQQKNSAIEIIYYERRSKDYPNGRQISMANGVLLEDKELPVGEFDIVKFDDIIVAGRYHSEAIVTHLRPIQDQYNVLRTKMAEWIRKMLAGKYLAAKGHGLGQESLNNESGEVVEYNPVVNAAPPQPMMTPMIPQYAYEDLNKLDDEFNQVSGLNEVSQGISPGASMPFRGMALLQEQDQTRISVQTSRNEVGYSRVCSILLKYISKYYVLPRILKIAGDGLEYAVKEFIGSDIDGNTDVICIPGSTVPNSKVLKRQDIINAFQLGLLGDPQDAKLRAKVLKMMEFGDVAEMWKDQALDQGQIKKAIMALEAGNMPENHEWDNHGLFVQELNAYRKTDKFEQMSMKQKAMLNWVVEWHIQALVSITNPQIPQQQMMAQHMVDTMHNMFAQGQGGPQQPGTAGASPQGPPPDQGPPIGANLNSPITQGA